MTHHQSRSLLRVARRALGITIGLSMLLIAAPTRAQSVTPTAPEVAPTAPAVAPAAPEIAPAAPEAAPTTPEVAPLVPAVAPAAAASEPKKKEKEGYKLGVHAELDVGALIALSQGAAFAGGVVWGPFRAGLSYATFLSNKTFGGTPDGFSLRANYILGINASYFIAQSTDTCFYVQAMFHIKEQGVTNEATGDHKDLSSLAAGLELGYVWKLYKGLYVAPRVGALYYVKSPQGPDNKPVRIGDRDYDNSRHKTFDTYYIPTLSVGYSW